MSPVRLLVNAPVPVPSLVLSSETVGPDDMLQHTPRSITAYPPSEVIVPPLTAVVGVIAVIFVVLSTGR
jgi:hypothetical protein